MDALLDWSGTSGDAWAKHWRRTDRALADVGSALDAAIGRLLPRGAFRALDVGCGPGSTALALAARRPDASVIGCDLSNPLIEIARRRAGGSSNVRFAVQDAETLAREEGPFDLILSRHGVMFFDDPVAAFATLRRAMAPGGRLVFSCFQAWGSNPWASQLEAAVADGAVRPPGREPGGFAFAECDHVRSILTASGWANPRVESLAFSYVAGEGPAAVDEAVALLAELGPASRALAGLPANERPAGLARLREAIAAYARDGRVAFPAAAWIWSAEA